MADSNQLRKNNLGGTVRKNDDINTESNFNSCVEKTFNDICNLYPNYTFKHEKSFLNTKLIETLDDANVPGEKILLGTGNSGKASPDGGIIYIKCSDNNWLPVFIGENKWQEDNPGNALERAVKNLVYFQLVLIKYDYFPYLINLNGGIVNESRGTYFDRITMVGGFMPINKVHVKSDPRSPRVRPFSFYMNKEFQFNAINKVIIDIINQSIEYLNEINKL